MRDVLLLNRLNGPAILQYGLDLGTVECRWCEVYWAKAVSPVMLH